LISLGTCTSTVSVCLRIHTTCRLVFSLWRSSVEVNWENIKATTSAIWRWWRGSSTLRLLRFFTRTCEAGI
jgi:hypothetical protein